MKVQKGASANDFSLTGLTFNELVVIRKACESYAKQGSANADALARVIGAAMDDMTV